MKRGSKIKPGWNKYDGWPTKETKVPTQVDTIDADIKPEIFGKGYISHRKPVRI